MTDPLRKLACASPQMQSVVQFIRTAAASNAPVLISGEPGVGKELVARAIHAQSLRQGRPFIPVSCWGSAERSVEEELFGTPQISLKLTQSERAGSLSLANSGTLLLDEIDALPIGTQAKLFKLLEAQNRPDVRILATIKDEGVLSQKVRNDLRYFLSAIQIRVPSLRERIPDLPGLTQQLLAEISEINRLRVTALDGEVQRRFQTYWWPGNVREMRSVLEHAALASSGTLIQARDLPSGFGRTSAIQHQNKTLTAELSEIRFPLGATVEQVERELILQTLKRTNNNKTRAAELLGISLKTLHNKLKEYGAQGILPDSQKS